ncbi:MAG: hypothetical protein LJE84_10615 [Gammaproteobacteria bacterium]|jgi:hypothetical protein|nr:hypothetical protein [Gammaproteobacteria bacterium]
MRYRVGDEPVDALAAFDPLSTATVVYALLLALAFVVLGRRYRQWWAVVWGGGLAVVSLIYLLAAWFGVDLLHR